ncbi:hypothetical protein TNCV_2203091 [Trichonephila clavipes]|uniref:Uncharacterized protein n=1 Tax=Trichonephila clavipes TaxID=2585209 RepID=A0A8X6S5A5_TRICX|nr:hypothetical protein TNCV_2203091 [Trichonephila clavipes]
MQSIRSPIFLLSRHGSSLSDCFKTEDTFEKVSIFEGEEIIQNAGYLSSTKQMPHRTIRAHYEQLLEFERGRIIRLKEAGRLIGESLAIRVEAMQDLLEDSARMGGQGQISAT